jgi:hypothetical protein
MRHAAPFSLAFLFLATCTPDRIATPTARSATNRASQALSTNSLGAGSLCADAPGAGTLECPSPATTPTVRANTTRYKQQVGTTATYQIVGATDAVAGTNSCLASEVAVQFESVLYGPSILCGTLAGTTVTFTYSAPAGACQIVNVVYRTDDPGTGFSYANSDILDGGTGTGTLHAGILFVDGSGSPVSCAGLFIDVLEAGSSENPPPVLTSVPAGTTVIARATALGSGNPLPRGEVTITFYSDATCSTGGSVVGIGNLIGGIAFSAPVGPLAAGNYSFRGHYQEPPVITAVYGAMDSPCAPLTVVPTVVTPTIDFHYDIITASSYGNPSGPWYCRTLEPTTVPAGTGSPDASTCPSSQGTVKVSTPSNTQTNDYLLTVTVRNNTGSSMLEKVQGGLVANAVCFANSAGVCYARVNNTISINAADITPGCGAAIIGKSSSKADNVVIWGNGTTSTNQSGFSMAPGAVCRLRVIVRTRFATIGNQPITGSWSDSRSPYTGALLVNVVP